jgi:hypothetical protein
LLHTNEQYGAYLLFVRLTDWMIVLERLFAALLIINMGTASSKTFRGVAAAIMGADSLMSKKG